MTATRTPSRASGLAVLIFVILICSPCLGLGGALAYQSSSLAGGFNRWRALGAPPAPAVAFVAADPNVVYVATETGQVYACRPNRAPADGEVLSLHYVPGKFLNAELSWVNLPLIAMERALDTVALARRKFPGAPASLDALCRRFGIDNSAREKHGALLDSELLAEVYLELIGGRQPDLVLAVSAGLASAGPASGWKPAPRPVALPARVTDEERAAHAALVEALGEGAIWKRFG